MVCLRRCYDAMQVGGRRAVLIGDVRRRGKYTPIVKDVLNFPASLRLSSGHGTAL